MAYTACALSLMLLGFGKAIVVTGSQLPLMLGRTDARQNLVDSMAVASAGKLREVALCFGGVVLRGNRAQKTNATVYRAFSSPTYPPLATVGVELEWEDNLLLRDVGVYRPRFDLVTQVMRVPCVPGLDPRLAYGKVHERGVRGLVLEVFGVGNMDDTPRSGWIPWLRELSKNGVVVFLGSQCQTGALHPELYQSGSSALKFGAHSTARMTPECAVVKLMLCLAYPTIPLDLELAGEL
eukprot:Plantae.Rhodophyta-Rhodochaete_pulchella.ctg23210.p1 GENE.Plantae.Rhodophyta-Rhodochaete_pulchella.ctg23210~~Plantae.Rhodophyta-Rhodochaete_pulchella.ctg23210.p1  ORF type:complete len:238 (+),score=24.23 Plantae.Rhodophyta-Rhodochaete_pulchella.ctg23210:2921-3634(+)